MFDDGARCLGVCSFPTIGGSAVISEDFGAHVLASFLERATRCFVDVGLVVHVYLHNQYEALLMSGPSRSYRPMLIRDKHEMTCTVWVQGECEEDECAR